MFITTLLVSLVVGLVSLYYYRIRQKLTYWQRRGIPCVEPDYNQGNFVGLGVTRSFADIWMDSYNKLKGTGPFGGFYMGRSPTVMVLTPEMAKLVLIKDFNKFTDRGFYSNPKDDPISGHIFFLDGHKWRSMRQKLSPVFTSGKMRLMYPTIMQIAGELTKVLENALREESTVEVHDLLARFTTDVIYTCAFGLECNSLRDPNCEFREMGRKAANDRRVGKVANFLMHEMPSLAKFLGVKMTPDHITDFYMRIVRENIAYREQNKIRRNDYFDMLLDLKNNKLMKTENGESLSITVEEILAQTYVFLQAGFDTSSTASSFALYELAQHEDIQLKVRQEIEDVLKRHDGKISYECISGMTYLNQVISETLRMYTVLPVLNRMCLEDYAVPGYPNYVIEKNMKILIPGGALHRDPDLYPDPNTFNPDRFAPEEMAARDGIKFLPFGEGPRNCIGMRFGLMQMRVGLASLIKNFKFSVCEKTAIPMQYNKQKYLVSPMDGIYLRVEKI